MIDLKSARRAPVAAAILVMLGALWALPAAQAAQAPVAAEHNPPGDIPDSQAFIVYSGAGFTMKVPEGWARHDSASGAGFNDKYNAIQISVADTSSAPTVASITANEVKQLEAMDRAVKVVDVKVVTLAGGTGVKVDYSINSAPNPVTNKQIRLEDVRYFVFAKGKLVTLDMAAPAGADNVDQWSLMSNSIRIK